MLDMIYDMRQEEFLAGLENNSSTYAYFVPQIIRHSISWGAFQPGDRVKINLENVPDDIQVICRLIRIDNQLRATSIIAEEIYEGKRYVMFQATLPDDENVIYLLTADAVSDNGDSLDSIYSVVHVPIQELEVKVMLDRNTDRSGTNEAVLYIKNTGLSTLSFGSSYFLEKQVGDTWESGYGPSLFTMEGYLLKPQEELQQTVWIERLEPGKYRFTKHFSIEGSAIEEYVTLYFSVK